MTIPEIFAKHGEPYFRAGEARVIARLLDSGPQVLATGGGAIMDQHTRELIRNKGISVWLKADLDVLLQRTKRRGDRPLAEKIKDLLPLREPIYAQSDIVVQSRDEPHDTIVDEIIAALPKPLGIAARGGQAMTAPLRQDGCRADRGAGRAGRRAPTTSSSAAGCSPRSASASRRCGRAPTAIVTDETVAKHHLAAAEAALKSAGIESSAIVVAAGEGSKSYATFESVCEAIVAARIERGDLVVALGGGVIGDLAGFAAACVAPRPRFRAGADDAARAGRFLGRRQDRHQFAHGKNLIGAFHQPILVDRRHRAARHAAAARIPRRLCRGRQIRPARRRRILLLAGSELAGRVRRRQPGGARARHRRLLPRQGRHRRARRARDRRARAAQSRPHLRPRAGSRLPASPAGCCTARRWRSAWSLAFDFSARKG